jgi:hypothetical protein
MFPPVRHDEFKCDKNIHTYPNSYSYLDNEEAPPPSGNMDSVTPIQTVVVPVVFTNASRISNLKAVQHDHNYPNVKVTTRESGT